MKGRSLRTKNGPSAVAPALVEGGAADVRERVDAIYRSESRRVFATLIRLLGDFDLAEEALQEAFRAALEQWSREGTPANPRAWLVSAGRFKAIDAVRRGARFERTTARSTWPNRVRNAAFSSTGWRSWTLDRASVDLAARRATIGQGRPR